MLLYTNPVLLKQKNFKVKVIANELLIHLILHYRKPAIYKNYLCSRCYRVPESIIHMLSYHYNQYPIENIIKQIINQIAEKEDLILSDINNFINNYTFLHINQTLPIRFITKRIQFPTDNIHLSRENEYHYYTIK